MQIYKFPESEHIECMKCPPCYLSSTCFFFFSYVTIQYYRLFPDEANVTPQWLPLVHEFYKQAASASLYFTSHTAHLVDSRQAKFCCQDDMMADLLCRILAENGDNACIVSNASLGQRCVCGICKHHGDLSSKIIFTHRRMVGKSL